MKTFENLESKDIGVTFSVIAKMEVVLLQCNALYHDEWAVVSREGKFSCAY